MLRPALRALGDRCCLLPRRAETSGRSTTNVDPSPSLDLTDTRPSMRWRAPADVKPEPGTLDAPRQVRIHSVELAEDPLLLPMRDPQPVVADLEAQAAFARLDAELHTTALRRVLDRVVDEVQEDLAELVRVTDDRLQTTRDSIASSTVAAPSSEARICSTTSRTRAATISSRTSRMRPCVELVGDQDVADDPRQTLAPCAITSREPVLGVVVELDVAPPKRLGAAVDGRQRGAQLVRDGGDELAFSSSSARSSVRLRT